MLDLDEMKQQWAEHDRTLQESIRLNRELLRETRLTAVRSAFERSAAFFGLEAAAWLAIVMALGSFIYGHAGTLRYALSGAALDVYAIGMLSATIRQFVAARQIDYGRPIAGIQKQLESLGVLRIRMTQWGVLAGVVVWAPFALVVAKALFGLDIDSAAWLWANVLFGLALAPLAVWLSKKFGDRMGRSPFLQQIMQDLAGRNLNTARAALASISAFQNEG